jgi:hypothetical protein
LGESFSSFVASDSPSFKETGVVSHALRISEAGRVLLKQPKGEENDYD